MRDNFIKILMIGAGLAILPLTAFGQLNTGPIAALPNELAVEMIPNYPRPDEMVFINLSLYTDDLNSANIAWYKDGKLVLNGKGQTKYSFRLGNVGEETDLEIRVNLLSGASFSKTFTLNPASVDLVSEANSYVPPFYKGKALPARQGSSKIVAMPEFVKNGKKISPQNLIYEWSNGVDAYQSQSGYGKNVLILNGSVLGKEDEVEVLVTDPTNNLVADSFINIVPTDPEIVFYENNPYYGHLFDLAVKNTFDLKTGEVQILAAPYYFSKEREGLLKYDWRLNGETVPNLVGSRTAIFKKPEGQSGVSNISLSIENLNRVLQQADAGLMIKFSN